MSEPIIKISEGHIKGYQKKNISDELFYCFEGIPYGKPPVGELRFKEPEPIEPWKGVRDTTSRDAGNYCKHVLVENKAHGIETDWKLLGSEDCLKLNVYTRSLPNSEKIEPKAVMFYIHGGAFVTGSTNEYHPEPLMSEDIVLVTIHYRLGALGFLVLNNPELGVTGNAGLKDMVLALRWVQKNIRFFNGNPNNVTIFGQSAGGASVNYLLLSKQATGLFHKAIIQSGTAFCYWATGDKSNGQKLAEALGCRENDPKKILTFLQTVPIEKLYDTQLVLENGLQPSSPRYFAPVIESELNKSAFLTEEPLKLITSGNYNQVPVMLGYTDMETSIYMMEDKKAPFNLWSYEDETLPPHMLGLKTKMNEFKKVAEKIVDFYHGKEKSDILSIPSILCSSDLAVIRSIIKLSDHFRKTMKEPVYLYRISTPMVPIFPQLVSKNITGAPHGAELFHLFRFFTEPKHVNGTEKKILKILLKLWTNFAKFSNPTPFENENLILWKPIDRKNLNIMDIGDELKMGVDPERERMHFWDGIFGAYPNTVGY